MKRLLTSASFACLLTLPVHAQPAAAAAVGPTHTVTVTVVGAKHNQHYIYLQMVDAEGHIVQRTREPLFDNKAVFTLKDVPSGEFAISTFHDENGNEKLDTKMFGIPSERYGFSNDAVARYGPPELEEQLFTIEANMELTIKL
jgi:uncharacterized protein (DUF2141 family)